MRAIAGSCPAGSMGIWCDYRATSSCRGPTSRGRRCGDRCLPGLLLGCGLFFTTRSTYKKYKQINLFVYDIEEYKEDLYA